MVIVVSPTISLIHDQVKRCTELGLKAMQLSDVKDINDLQEDIVFSTPESLLSEKWRKSLLSEEIKKRIIGVVVDEAHLVVKWYVVLSIIKK